MLKGKTINLNNLEIIWYNRFMRSCEFVIAEPLKRRDYKAIAKLKREGLIDVGGLMPNKCCLRLKEDDTYEAYKNVPFRERFWWTPIAIAGVSIAISSFLFIRQMV